MTQYLNNNYGPVFKHRDTRARMRIGRHVKKRLLPPKSICSSRVALRGQSNGINVICRVKSSKTTHKPQVLLQIGKMATESHVKLVKVYTTEVVRKQFIYDWFKPFRERTETVVDKSCSGRSSTSTTPDNIDRTRNTSFFPKPTFCRCAGNSMTCDIEASRDFEKNLL